MLFVPKSPPLASVSIPGPLESIANELIRTQKFLEEQNDKYKSLKSIDPSYD